MNPSVTVGARKVKRFRASKETSFNITSALLVNAVIVFLPERLQESPYIINAVTAWFALGNIFLRYAAIRAEEYWRQRRELVHAKVEAGGLVAEGTVKTAMPKA